MSQYSNSERMIARALSRFPRLKQIIKAVYARLVYARSRKSYRFDAVSDVEAVLPASSGQSQADFFGYYDKSPVNAVGDTLGHCTSVDTAQAPSPQTAAAVTVVGNDSNVKADISVRAYNWQQGTRAQWLSDDKFMFNDYDETRQGYVARVWSVSSASEVKRFDRPVQDAFGTDYFLSLNYRRLMALRPDYGYRNVASLADQELGQLDDDGIWRVNYDTGNSELLISLRDACDLGSLPSTSSDGYHLFNHVMISPSGGKFIFLHRVFSGERRADRLLLAEAKTGNLSILADYGMVSHCFWADDSTILGYMRGPETMDGYWLIDTESGQFQRIGEQTLDSFGDGHPHVYGDWFVTDTYPDKARMQHLILCNWKTGEVKHLGEFFHGFRFAGESRCDLHPRFSQDGKAVYFDSVFTGKRQLYRLELSQ